MDPLTPSYPELTPYQFASNRPINGIDLDGLEYVDFNQSNYKLSLGQTWLTRARFYELYGNIQGYAISGTTRLDGNGEKYQGATLPVSQNIYRPKGEPSANSFSGGVQAKDLGEVHNGLSNEFQNAKKNHLNLLTGRTGRDLNSEITSANAGRASLARANLVFVGVGLAYDAAMSVKGYSDMVDNSAQEKFVTKSWLAVNTAVQLGLIPTKFQTIDDLSLIADFVYRGTPIDGNPVLKEIAELVSKTVAENFKYPAEFNESGLDNVPTKRIYNPVLKIDNEDKKPKVEKDEKEKA